MQHTRAIRTSHIRSRDRQFVQGGHLQGLHIRNEQFLFRSDFIPLQFELACKGGGIAVTHQKLALAKGLIQIDSGIVLPTLPIYLVCHRDVQHNPRVRVMMEFLGDNLPRLFA